MKTKFFTGIIAAGLSMFIITSCNNSVINMTPEKGSELKKKELELKEKELTLKEKELSQQNYDNQSTKEKKTRIQDENAAFYIINVAAMKKESDAKTKVQELEKNGYKSDYLWIPDYNSLSGALFYTVYIGPYYTQYECEVATEEYRKIHSEAYGLLVSQESKRVQILGIGKVTISEVLK
jgi:cell division septation protein DedD